MSRTLKDYKEIEVTLRNMLTYYAKAYMNRRAELRKALKLAQDRQRQILGMIVKVVLIFLIGFISGCCTIKGICEDTSWTLKTAAENIQPKQ